MYFLDPVYDVKFQYRVQYAPVVTFINSSYVLKIENKSIICFEKLYPVTSYTDDGTVIQYHVAT